MPLQSGISTTSFSFQGSKILLQGKNNSKRKIHLVKIWQVDINISTLNVSYICILQQWNDNLDKYGAIDRLKVLSAIVFQFFSLCSDQVQDSNKAFYGIFPPQNSHGIKQMFDCRTEPITSTNFTGLRHKLSQDNGGEMMAPSFCVCRACWDTQTEDYS